MPLTPIAIQKYQALISQTGTNEPTVTIIQNTLGKTVNWTRTYAGRYSGTSTGAFTPGKTICHPFGNSSQVLMIPIGNETPLQYCYSITTDSDHIILDIFDATNYENVELSTAAPGSNLLINIEIFN